MIYNPLDQDWRSYSSGFVGALMGNQRDLFPETLKTLREVTLDTAKQAVTQDRNASYGSPEENFQQIAKYWSEFLGREVTTVEVAALLVLVKVARLRTSPNKLDNWVDIAGYAACGAECARAK